MSTQPVAPRCQVCGNKTLDPSGRCHLHRGLWPEILTMVNAVASTPPSVARSDSIESSVSIHNHPGGTPWVVVHSRDLGPHREDGPAVVEYHLDGSVKRQEWWVNSNQLEETDAAELMQRDGTLGFHLWNADDVAVLIAAGVSPDDANDVLTEHDLDNGHAIVAYLLEGVPLEWARSYGSSQE